MKTKNLQIALAAGAILIAMACTSKSKNEGASDSDTMMMNADTSGVMMDTTSTLPDTAMKDTSGAKMPGDTTSMAPRP